MPSPLALHGGEPLTRREWPFYNAIGEEEKAEVRRVLDSGLLSEFIAAPGPRFLGGAMVRRLEEDWARRFGSTHAVSMNSATSCLHAALAACGVGPGDEVITPQLGMSASAAVIPALGATPVFADCDPVTLHLDPDHAARLVTPRTSALVVVHLAGTPAPMDEIMALARKHGLKVVEDNAQAPGALYKGREAGTIGHVGCFSLNCHKIIQCGEGGVACTDDPELALRLRLFRNHAEKCEAAFGLEAWGMYGLNLRLTELSSAVAIHQLAKLDALNAATVALCERLTAGLDLPGIRPPRPAPGCSHVYYIYHWEYREEEVGVPAAAFAAALQAEGLPVYAHYGYLISDLPPFNGGRAPSPPPQSDPRWPGASRAIRDSLWTMLIRPHLEPADVDLLAAGMRKVYDQRHTLREDA
jgi:dTDP-4-amino-4,6-dideoxygalactose transaminase